MNKAKKTQYKMNDLPMSSTLTTKCRRLNKRNYSIRYLKLKQRKGHRGWNIYELEYQLL